MAGFFLPPATPPAGPLISWGAVGGSVASLRSVADISRIYRGYIGAGRRYTTLVFSDTEIRQIGKKKMKRLKRLLLVVS